MPEPYAHSKTKFDIQNLAAAWSSEHLNSIMTKIDIKVDESQLKERNVTKEQLLSQLYTDVALSDKTYEFTKPNESLPQSEDSHKDFILKSKIAFLTRAAIFKRLESEALETFLKIRHTKALYAALREYIHKIAEENYQRFMFEAENERLKLENRMNEQILAELERLNKEAWESWHLFQAEIDKLDTHIHQLRSQRKIILDKHINSIVTEVSNFRINNSDPFKGMNKDQKQQFAVDFAVEYQVNLQKILQKEHKRNKISKDLNALTVRETAREAELLALHAPAVNLQNRKQDYKTFPSQLKMKQEISKITTQDNELNDIREQKKILQVQKTEIDKAVATHKGENVVKNCLEKQLGSYETTALLTRHPGFENKFVDYMKKQEGFSEYQEAASALNRNIHQAKEDKNTIQETQDNLIKENAKIQENLATKSPTSSLAERLKQRRAALQK
ncbi:MAG: hypothetical protein JSS07_10870 [Proteobacteria bacterium]|nr:hypothetical protein [Pseudomonadota bacterium]